MFASNSPYSPFFTSGLLSHSMLDGGTDKEYRSFLSLDLAEPHSLKRKPPPSLRSRSSRDSLRSIPSPKPAPSATLPELPQHTPCSISSAPPRLPSLIPIPALELPLPSLSLTISRTPAPLSPIRRISVATKATSSSVSTRVRRSNRSAALARLEGRPSRHDPLILYIKPSQQQRNFMNMSDDEDEHDQNTDLDSLNLGDFIFPNPVLEPEDVVLPTFSFLEPPRPTSLLPRTSSPSVRRRRARVPKTKDWIPFKSFIDLHNDDDSSSWAWRSFIQVADVS